MEPLITVKDVAERYGCSLATARKYIRKCNPHMEDPLCAYERDFCKWEASRMRYSVRLTKADLKEIEQNMRREDKIFVPRRRV